MKVSRELRRAQDARAAARGGGSQQGEGRGKTRRVTNQRMRDVWNPEQSLPAAELKGNANTVGPRHSHT